VKTLRVLLGAAGLAAMGFAGYGLVTDDGVRLVGVVPFLLGLVVAHDLILMPVAIGVGVLVLRYVPPWGRSSIQGGLFVSAVVFAFALPFLIGAGRPPDNPSKFPLNYGLGLAIVLGAIWLAAAGLALRARRKAR
jgi:hypothetical protein